MKEKRHFISNWIKGAGSLFDWSGSTLSGPELERRLRAKLSDPNSDWLKIGGDFHNALHALVQERAPQQGGSHHGQEHKIEPGNGPYRVVKGKDATYRIYRKIGTVDD